MIRDYLNYRLNWQTRHDIHSPFIFDFIETVLRDKKKYPEYAGLQALRTFLSNDQTEISLTDLGAGSRNPASKKTVATILKTAVQRQKYQELLFRMMRKFDPQQVIELGTSLGLTTAYLQKGLSGDAKLYSLEGDPAMLKYAETHTLKGIKSGLELIEGNFDDTLPGLLSRLDKVDVAFIDGNHTYEATLNYFRLLLPKMAANGILIFDDIYWSEGMKKAWSEIREHAASQYTADLFQWGIVFLEPVKVKQQFTLKF